MRMTGIALRGPGSRRWEREEQREREAKFAEALRAAESLTETRERIRQRIADDREAAERQRRRQRSREEHAASVTRLRGGRDA